jgi:pimeloyl-ACP methyl ester carboxylesterase
MLLAGALAACASPVRTRVAPWAAPPGSEDIARQLAQAPPEEVLKVAREAWSHTRAGDPLTGSSVARLNLVVSTILRRLPGESEAFRRAGLAVPDSLARGTAVEASRIHVVGLSRRFQRAGLGVPLSLELPALSSSRGAAKHPPEGHLVPATAVLSFDPTSCPVLSLVDPRRFDSIRVGERAISLAGDFTAPYARLLDRADLHMEGRLALLEPFTAARQGLFLLEDYDPGKTPLVMVHGLGSSPLAWRELTNTVFGVPELRRRFQVWHYYYPTGAPYLWAGKEFRETLDAVLSALGADGDDVSKSDMVLVGHSMGGMLAKTAVSNSGYRLWDLAFAVPPEDLRVRDEDREMLRGIFVFERLPYVTRAVFVMSPHRGSEVARSWFAGLGTTFITLPRRFSGLLRRLVDADPEGVRPAFRELFRRGGPSSVQALRSDHPLFPTLAEVPLDPAVQVHSIIGDVGDGSDGVVSIESALLDGAASTEVVPVGHQALEDPSVTEAIVRVLRQHASTSALDAGESTYTPGTCSGRPARTLAGSACDGLRRRAESPRG